MLEGSCAIIKHNLSWECKDVQHTWMNDENCKNLSVEVEKAFHKIEATLITDSQGCRRAVSEHPL